MIPCVITNFLALLIPFSLPDKEILIPFKLLKLFVKEESKEFK
jgi:hypothetical protein